LDLDELEINKLLELAQLSKLYNSRSRLLTFNIRSELIKRYQHGYISLSQLVRSSVYLSECHTSRLHLGMHAMASDDRLQLNVIDQMALMV
jgi:hypothetical protein